jgi:hypothetical protein
MVLPRTLIPRTLECQCGHSAEYRSSYYPTSSPTVARIDDYLCSMGHIIQIVYPIIRDPRTGKRRVPFVSPQFEE